MAKQKKFKLRGDQIKPLAQNHGGCFATDMITVLGYQVGFMYREEPDNDIDSGWRFLAGRESESYMDDADNTGAYDVNTIANYDPDIIPFLHAPVGTAFERDGKTNRFIQVEGDAWDPGAKSSTPRKQWPPPGFPLVEGDYALTPVWSIHLPAPFARRVEDNSLVLWRPGITLWIAISDDDRTESLVKRLARIKKRASTERFAEREHKSDNALRYSYRLQEDTKSEPVEALYSFHIIETEQLHVAVYFDEAKDEFPAQQLVDSVRCAQ